MRLGVVLMKRSIAYCSGRRSSCCLHYLNSSSSSATRAASVGTRYSISRYCYSYDWRASTFYLAHSDVSRPLALASSNTTFARIARSDHLT